MSLLLWVTRRGLDKNHHKESGLVARDLRMDVSASQCSGSGCQSGWTMYLDQSSLSKTQYQGFDEFVGRDCASLEEGEEDLSMVSDASSGPPHFCEYEEENCFYQFDNKKSKVRNKTQEHGRSQQYSSLDDTASSARLGKASSQRMVRNEASIDGAEECSQGFSGTHFKGKSALKKQLGLVQSSRPEKSASKKPGGFQGRI